MLRHLAGRGAQLLGRWQGEAAAADSVCRSACYSTLPEDLQQLAARARWPVRKHAPPQGAAGEAAAAGGGAAAGLSPEAAAKQVQAATPWMFPWERRQLQGGDLRWWEKMYWGVFVVGIALILFNRIEWEKAPDPKAEERKQRLERERQEAARMVLAGKSILVPWGTDDPFGGMTPQEIEEFCSKVTGGASTDDPFEGLTPQEIDEYIEKHGMPASAGSG